MTSASINGAPSLVQRAMEAVTAHIREGSLKVGDTLPGEGHFAGQLGVSRAVMREAFGALAALRLINVGNGRKPRVGAIDGAVFAASLSHGISTAQITVSHIWDVRRTIEVRTAALAATNRSDAQAARLVELADLIAEGTEDGPPTAHDIEFHILIAEAGGNPLLVAIVRSFEPLLNIAVPEAWKTRQTQAQKDEIFERHRRLAQAIANRDPTAAALAMEQHFDASIGALLDQATAL